MPKKLKHESQAEQSERFKRDAQKLIDAGELNPTEADAAVDRLIRKSIHDHGA
jgi:polyhydroxyalkanoate synthesis regulator phasin